MVPLMSLWPPILLSAVIVFFVSFIVHMVLSYHRSDFAPAPNEDAAQDALRAMKLAPGDYLVPCPSGPAGMKDPAYLEKQKKGPVLVMTVFPPGAAGLGVPLIQWFIYCIVVGVFAAYIAGQTLGPGTAYLRVFQITGTVAFVGYTIAYWQNSIWYRRKWSTTLKVTFDGLLFALCTGGTFGWLWPK